MDNEEKILKMLEQMQSQIKENTQILKALEHKVDVVKAEQDKFIYQMAETSAKVENINSKVDIIVKDLNFVEVATGKNITDIAFLKSVK